MRKVLLIFLLFNAVILIFPEEHYSEQTNDQAGQIEEVVKILSKDYFYFFFGIAYYPPHSLGTVGNSFSSMFIRPVYDSVDSERELNWSSWGGVKLVSKLGYNKFLPLLNNKDSLLFEDNGISLNIEFSLSPVTVFLKGMVSFIPIAFLDFYTALEVGIGWTVLGFRGIGIHKGNGLYSDEAGFYLQYKVGGMIKFDFNAIFGGDWTHILTVVGSEFIYLTNPNAKKNQLWAFKSDSGCNLNGFTFSPYVFFGYKMPIPLELIGILYEGKTYLGEIRNLSPIDNQGWGSDYFEHSISLITDVQIMANLHLGLQFKFLTAPLYTKNSQGFADITKRKATGVSYFYYDSVGLSFNYRFN